MCGIVGIFSNEGLNQMLYDSLLVLQHRGQDAAGIVTSDENIFKMHKGSGLVRDVFRTRNMLNLTGNMGIGHCRYPTSGSVNSYAEAQPLYVNSPFGIVLAHNGNLINADNLTSELFKQDFRHINTNSDSEILLNIFAHELQSRIKKSDLNPSAVFEAVSNLHKRLVGAYAVVSMIAGFGLIAFRDPYGIRPLILGERNVAGVKEFMVASESVALDSLGFKIIRDLLPGETIVIDMNGKIHYDKSKAAKTLSPCIFEYVYLARPDSVIDGISVHETRLKMGKNLALQIKKNFNDLKIDTVIPIPDSSRPSAMELAKYLGVSYREGFIKNRYIGRTFIMPGQEIRRKSVRQKLNAIGVEFKNKNVLLVDDSIVRGTTSREIVQMARESGAKKVFFASAAPPVRFPNVYGIDMPSPSDLIAFNKTKEEISVEIGADKVIYQTMDDLINACIGLTSKIENFEASCFTGEYITGGVTSEYLSVVEEKRKEKNINALNKSAGQLDLNLSSPERNNL